jgi:nucleoside-diphosphate-sugar epimerase
MTINLGTGREVSILELANTIIRLCERRGGQGEGRSEGRSPIIEIDPERLRPVRSEVGRLLSDNRLALENLGWKPMVDLEEGLQLTIDWIAANLKRYRPGTYQI